MLDIVGFCGLTIVVFLGWFTVQQKTRKVLLNPVLMSLLTLIGLFLLLGIPYSDYMQGAQYINILLEPAVVLLGYPLYKQLRLLRAQWRKIVLICFIAAFSSLTISALLANVMGLEDWLIASLVTLNITTAIAMSTSAELGGTGAITANIVFIGGMTGSIAGVYWLRLIGVIQPISDNLSTSSRESITEQKALGLAIGSTAHAIGTATIVKEFPLGAAYSSTALILCAIISAIIAPFYIPLLLSF
ncbi:LrgB family protein [Alteromonadaceae bacterium BrNp21-10]|nr:LrgB family protein [Alteromonadaceae bacterium BrNp21-10]